MQDRPNNRIWHIFTVVTVFTICGPIIGTVVGAFLTSVIATIGAIMSGDGAKVHEYVGVPVAVHILAGFFFGPVPAVITGTIVAVRSVYSKKIKVSEMLLVAGLSTASVFAILFWCVFVFIPSLNPEAGVRQTNVSGLFVGMLWSVFLALVAAICCRGLLMRAYVLTSPIEASKDLLQTAE